MPTTKTPICSLRSTNNGNFAPMSSLKKWRDNGEAVLTEDDSEIRLQAVDPEGGAGVQTISITILPTEAPTASIISPLPAGVCYSDQKITFEALVEDEEDDADQLVAIWTSDLDGELDVDAEVNSAGTAIGYGYLTQGEQRLNSISKIQRESRYRIRHHQRRTTQRCTTGNCQSWAMWTTKSKHRFYGFCIRCGYSIQPPYGDMEARQDGELGFRRQTPW